jgi:hypothetical protein
MDEIVEVNRMNEMLDGWMSWMSRWMSRWSRWMR